MIITNFKVEETGLVSISYTRKLEEDDKTIWIMKDAAIEFLAETYKYQGITRTNAEDFMLKQDPKYSIEDYHIKELLKSYFM